MTHNVLNFIFLEQVGDARIQRARDVAASTNNLAPIHGDIRGLKLKSPFGAVRDRLAIQLGIVQQRLGWNATPVQTHATKFVALNARHL